MPRGCTSSRHSDHGHTREAVGRPWRRRCFLNRRNVSGVLEKHGRPLRIAVDEAAWRFNNLTSEQAAAIQEGEPAANPIEKAIFHRAIKLLRLNVQLLFVFDGPHRPWKRGRRGGGKIDYELIKLTTKMLDMLRIPTHRAPGEAEAECARLQQEGIVDAVLSEDGDALMFGAEVLFRTYYEGKKKSITHVRVYKAADVQERHGLDRQGMICFAMLAGGDYGKGLPGCGPNKALKAARHGLGESLCRARDPELQEWRLELMSHLKGSVTVPFDFPDPKILKKYRNLCVGTSEELHALRALKKGWDGRPIDEVKLRSFLRTTFNIWTKGYLRHIVPLLLVKNLAQTQPGQEASNMIYNIEVAIPRRNRKNQQPHVASVERKISFLPQPVTSLDLSYQPDGPEGEIWSQLETKTDGPFNPFSRIECEVLECILRAGAPYALDIAVQKQVVRESAKSKPRKRTTQSEPNSETTVAEPATGKRGQKRKSTDPHEGSAHGSKNSKKRKPSSQDFNNPTTVTAGNSADKANSAVTLTPPVTRETGSYMVDLTLESDDEEEENRGKTDSPKLLYAPGTAAVYMSSSSKLILAAQIDELKERDVRTRAMSNTSILASINNPVPMSKT